MYTACTWVGAGMWGESQLWWQYWRAPCLHRGVSLSLCLFGLTCLDIKSASSPFEHTGPICQLDSILDWMDFSFSLVDLLFLLFVRVSVCVRMCL